MSSEAKHSVQPLGGGLYRVTTTIERTLTEEELHRLGIPLPGADLPWHEPALEATPPRRAQPQPQPSPMGRCLAHWRMLFDGFDHRLPGALPQWLDEFGEDGIISAFDEVKANPSREPKYERLKKILQHRRKQGAR